MLLTFCSLKSNILSWIKDSFSLKLSVRLLQRCIRLAMVLHQLQVVEERKILNPERRIDFLEVGDLRANELVVVGGTGVGLRPLREKLAANWTGPVWSNLVMRVDFNLGHDPLVFEKS